MLIRMSIPPSAARLRWQVERPYPLMMGYQLPLAILTCKATSIADQLKLRLLWLSPLQVTKTKKDKLRLEPELVVAVKIALWLLMVPNCKELPLELLSSITHQRLPMWKIFQPLIAIISTTLF